MAEQRGHRHGDYMSEQPGGQSVSACVCLSEDIAGSGGSLFRELTLILLTV